MKKLIAAIIIILILCIALAGLRLHINHRHTEQQAKTQSPIFINSSQVVVRKMPNQVNTIGSLSAWQQIDLAPEISGVIQAIYFKGGQSVTTGQKLVQLDNDVYRAAVNSAKADYQAIKAKFNRYQQLQKTRSIAPQDYDDVLANYQVKVANLNSANTKMNKMLLLAPFNGVISQRLEDVGQYVASGTPIAQLVNKSKLKLHYSLPEKYLHQLKIGQTVKLNTNAVPNHTFSGKLIYIAPSINPNARTIPLTAEFDNSNNRLSPGLFGTVTQILGYFDNTIVIPDRAIVPTISGPMVYEIRDNTAYLTPVTVGIRHNGLAQITHGLKPNSVVAVSGLAKLKDGAPVNQKRIPINQVDAS